MIDGYFVFKMGNELIPEKNLVEEVWRIYTKFFLPVIPEFCSTKTIPGRNVQRQNQSKKVFLYHLSFCVFIINIYNVTLPTVHIVFTVRISTN